MHGATLSARPIELLLVEDNPDDVRLTIETLREGRVANQLHDMQLAQRYEVTCYLQKPIDVEQLIELVALVQEFGITVTSVAA